MIGIDPEPLYRFLCSLAPKKDDRCTCVSTNTYSLEAIKNRFKTYLLCGLRLALIVKKDFLQNTCDSTIFIYHYAVFTQAGISKSLIFILTYKPATSYQKVAVGGLGGARRGRQGRRCEYR